MNDEGVVLLHVARAPVGGPEIGQSVQLHRQQPEIECGEWRLAGGSQPKAGSLECAILAFEAKDWWSAAHVAMTVGRCCMAWSISENVSKRRRHHLKLARVEMVCIVVLGRRKQASRKGLVLSCVSAVVFCKAK